MLNLGDELIKPESRQPRGAIQLSGTVITRDSSGTETSRESTKVTLFDCWESWEVDNNSYRGADTFRINLIASALPEGMGIDWFSSQSLIGAEIFANESPVDPDNYLPDSSDSLIYGSVDEVSYNPVSGTIELHGRDLTAVLIDTKSSEHYVNKTSSEIATLLATKHGLGTELISKTKTKAGVYYQIDHDNLKTEQSDWDLLIFLATMEGFLVYVKGKNLFFGKQKTEKDVYLLNWDKPNEDRAYTISNAVTLNFSRALHISKGVTVEVHSWNSKQKTGFSAYFPKTSKGIRPGQAVPRTQNYRYTVPNLTQEQAIQKAQVLYRQIIAHEMSMTAYLPADSILNCEMILRVQGTDSSFDQDYYPESVMRSMSIGEGYRMNIRAKNTSPELAATS
jgi:phage protein D